MRAKHLIGDFEGFLEGAKTFRPPNCPTRSKVSVDQWSRIQITLMRSRIRSKEKRWIRILQIRIKPCFLNISWPLYHGGWPVSCRLCPRCPWWSRHSRGSVRSSAPPASRCTGWRSRTPSCAVPARRNSLQEIGSVGDPWDFGADPDPRIRLLSSLILRIQKNIFFLHIFFL